MVGGTFCHGQTPRLLCPLWETGNFLLSEKDTSLYTIERRALSSLVMSMLANSPMEADACCARTSVSDAYDRSEWEVRFGSCDVVCIELAYQSLLIIARFLLNLCPFFPCTLDTWASYV